MTPPVRLATSAVVLAASLASGYGLGLRFAGSRNIAIGGAAVAGAAGGALVYALSSAVPEVAAIGLHNYVAEIEDPASVTKDDVEKIASRYGVSKGDEAFQAEICDIYCRYVTSVLPAEGQSLRGDEVEKIVKFKSALGIDDPDAASMHMEIGRRIFRQRLETGEREGDAEQRRAFMRLVYVSALVFGDAASFLLPWKRVLKVTDAQVEIAIRENAKQLYAERLKLVGREHMLFMGSTEFPDENEYDSYLSKHGGSSNAYTEMEHTCYHFEVKREFLQGALKRFSQFFVAPLMKTEAMEREVLAVDSEFNQALQNDACRLQQLQCYTSAKGHPFNRFSWGNKKSLSGAMENGVDLRECIVKLYKEYYRGGLMKLVVIGGESLDTLESWVVELFGNVKNGSKIRPTLEAKGPIWEGGKLYRLEAVKDVHTLDLTWTLPPLRHAYVKKPEDYLAHLLGHEGRGSLLSFLKGMGWATSLSAGVGDDGINRSSLAYVFGMSIHLTDSGLEKIYDIIGYVYQYLKLLRDMSPQEWIFKELQDIGNMDFRYAEEQAADDYAAELSENMLAYPVEHIIYGDYVYQTWDPKMIEDLMGFFIPKNMRIDVVSKSIKSEEFQTEPWFGSHYIVEDVPLALMETWSNPSEVDKSLHLPSENQFIPSDFSIRAINSDGDPKSQSPPKCIIDEPLMKFWYKLDETFKVPRANTYFRINLKGAYGSVKNCLLTELFINLLKDELNEIIYQASIAKLETSLSMYGDKLELKVYGFNEKIPALLSKILAIAKSFMPSLDRFKVIKENMERGLRNTNMKPLNHSTYLRLQLLCKRIYDSDEKLSVLNDISLSDLNSFIPEVRSQIFIEALCHGNLSEDEAVNISNIFKNSLTVEPLPVKSRHGEQITCFPLSAKLVRDVNVKNKSETNSVVELYYQIEPEEAKSTRMKAVVDLFSEIIEEPLFNQLRTKEQLGYVVECGPRLTYRVHGFCFCVQSSKYGPVHLLGRIDNFIKDIEGMLEQLDEESFEDYRSGLIGRLLEKDPSLLSETNELWSQIVDKRYVFDYSQKEAEELRSIEKKDVINWYKTYFKESSPKSRRLAVRVWGCNTNVKETQTDTTKSVQVIADAVAFKSTSKFYPSLC